MEISSKRRTSTSQSAAIHMAVPTFGSGVYERRLESLLCATENCSSRRRGKARYEPFRSGSTQALTV